MTKVRKIFHDIIKLIFGVFIVSLRDGILLDITIYIWVVFFFLSGCFSLVHGSLVKGYPWILNFWRPWGRTCSGVTLWKELVALGWKTTIPRPCSTQAIARVTLLTSLWKKQWAIGCMPSVAAPDVRLKNQAGWILKKNKKRNISAKAGLYFFSARK